MKVYRLERNDYGVFCEYDSKIAMPFSDDALYSQFGYTCNQMYRDNYDWRSACESLEELVEYFGSDFAYALERGADIVEYNIHKAHVRFGLLPDEDSIEVVFNSTKIIDKLVIHKGFEGDYEDQ